MKIDISKQEYADLILMASIGERVICNDTSLDDYTDEQRSVKETLSTLCRHAHAYGLGEMVEEYEGEWHLTEDAIQEVFERMDEYEEEYVFWETGAKLLAQRDCAEKYAEEEWSALPVEERRKIMLEKRMEYLKEWEEHGYSRLRIVGNDNNV